MVKKVSIKFFIGVKDEKLFTNRKINKTYTIQYKIIHSNHNVQNLKIISIILNILLSIISPSTILLYRLKIYYTNL